MINVQNNFLNNFDFMEINNRVENKNFPWYLDIKEKLFYHDLIIIDKKKDLFIQSPFINILTPFVHSLKIKKINLAKLVFKNKTDEIIKYPTIENKELYDNSKTSYFFFNSCNGYIQFINHNKIDFIENRILTFSSQLPYFTTSHTNKEFCIILFINYLSEDKLND